jgi:hypothetical protein
MTQGGIARIGPLIDELRPFCIGHELGDGGLAATQMLRQVRELWPEVPALLISSDHDSETDPEVLALRIVADVGGVAERLLRLEPQEELGWARANLIVDLDHYLDAVAAR